MVVGFMVFAFFVFISSDLRGKQVYYYMAVGIAISTVCLAIFFFITEEVTYTLKYSLAIVIPLFLYGFYILQRNKPKNTIEILAKQQSYCDSIQPKEIYKAYSYRTLEKKDRIETRLNTLSKTFYRESEGNKFLTTNFFYELQSLELTRIQNIDEIQSLLHKEIFSMIQNAIIYKEMTLAYNEILKENDYILEYFLMQLYEQYTIAFNIGVANLKILANTFTEEQLVGALDNLSLQSVKRDGAALFYSYLAFKNRV